MKSNMVGNGVFGYLGVSNDVLENRSFESPLHTPEVPKNPDLRCFDIANVRWCGDAQKAELIESSTRLTLGALIESTLQSKG